MTQSEVQGAVASAGSHLMKVFTRVAQEEFRVRPSRRASVNCHKETSDWTRAAM